MPVNLRSSHDLGPYDPDPWPQEKSMKNSYVSFETECTMYMWVICWHIPQAYAECKIEPLLPSKTVTKALGQSNLSNLQPIPQDGLGLSFIPLVEFFESDNLCETMLKAKIMVSVDG